MVGFSRLYCSILETTAGVATFGLDPPIRPGGRRVPVEKQKTQRSALQGNLHTTTNVGRIGTTVIHRGRFILMVKGFDLARFGHVCLL